MFGLGFTEILFLAGLALIVIGPKQLPDVARTLGRLLNELRRSTNVFTEELKAQTQIDRNILRPEVREQTKSAAETQPTKTEDRHE